MIHEMYRMPCPRILTVPDDSGTVVRLAEAPPPGYLPAAAMLADAEPDTMECNVCGVRIGHVLEAIRGILDVPDWENPNLIVDGDRVLFLCDLCAGDLT
jgi:hypothetical protein